MDKESENTTLVGGLIDEKALEQEAQERERNAVQIALASSLYKLHDRQKEIDDIFDSMKLKVAWKNVKVILVSEIKEAIKDIIVVPEFSTKTGPKQLSYGFVGTHWMTVEIQIFYDFIKKACDKIGLSVIYYEDPAYMKEIFEQVFFTVSHFITTVQPFNGVWINLKNCTVEINSDGSFGTHEHDPKDFFKYSLPYCYDKSADCPLWHKFLDEVLPEKEAQTLLGEYMGYCLTSSSSLNLERFLVLWGGGSNGKSVCMNVLRKLYGNQNVSQVALDNLTNDPVARANLQDKLVNISSESGKNLNTAVLKMVISGEPVEVRILWYGMKIMYNPPKLITSYNELPPVENTHGYRRRWILIPFTKTIPEGQQDPALADKLCEELPGILNWVLENLSNLIKKVNSHSGESFTKSPMCTKALNDYFRSSNSAILFLDECCKIDETSTQKLKDVYDNYKAYCLANGFKNPIIKKNFKKFIAEWGATLSCFNNVSYVNVKVNTSVYL